MRNTKKIRHILFHVVAVVLGFIMIYPLLWMVMSSFKPSNEIFANAGSLFPKEFFPSNYSTGWKGFGGIRFSVFFKNSFTISLLSTAGSVFSSACIAYGLSRLRFKGRKIWFVFMLLTMMLPFQIIMIPQYIIFNRAGWIGTILPLVVPSYFGGGFFIFLIMQFIYGIPKDLDEAAKIDGCSFYGIFARVIMPLIVPALITSAIFAFMWKWDDFLASLLYLNNPSNYTVSLALKMFSDPSAQSDWGAMFAMATLSILPIMLIFIFCQKYLVEGISTEGLKG
ncbi:multiple sugar transport system permease protein [Anaerocolumna jejuensis DSM 15929]|uniref:Multiple sugar transport system permease protein n=1 Tax=Anaerocolumna jejuensis DSM 15929 TaxID=1121322 RepID=A0A1M6RCM0_9FIRM|nr:carbohydrate ABC transporter permease [Anaerocolumna jejuensis]SHK30176.1 multiple sugar transport system permease protein [Anaerocolumna jejuensis DSM 15929]